MPLTSAPPCADVLYAGALFLHAYGMDPSGRLRSRNVPVGKDVERNGASLLQFANISLQRNHTGIDIAAFQLLHLCMDVHPQDPVLSEPRLELGDTYIVAPPHTPTTFYTEELKYQNLSDISTNTDRTMRMKYALILRAPDGAGKPNNLIRINQGPDPRYFYIALRGIEKFVSPNAVH